MDGGWHFSRSEPYVPLGRSVAKWRCLEMRGWRVVSVPWFRWFELQVRFGGGTAGRGEGGCLEMRGWRVVSVPWFRWFELQVRSLA